MRMTALVPVLIGAMAASGLVEAPEQPEADVPARGGDALRANAGGVAALGEVPQEGGTIVDVAVENGSFETLVQALEAAELVETLSGDGPFTVFAPTDEAFSKLPEGALEDLLNDRERLTRVLTHHVVDGRVTAEQVMKMSSAETLAGDALPIRVEGESVHVGDATVVQADVMASNGVIHVIDTVLLPGDGE